MSRLITGSLGSSPARVTLLIFNLNFYLIDSNTIVEIKSEYTLNEEEMKDKVKAYRELGYNVKLIVNHNEVEI